MLTIVTGWSPKGWSEYAHRFASTFVPNLPKGVKIVSYIEDDLKVAGIETRDVLSIEGCREFIEKYRNDDRANGRDVQPNWKQSCKDKRYNFRFDAWKFCRQGFIPYHALKNCETRYLAWLDADVIAKRPIPQGFIESLLPEGKCVAYLGREPKFSEIGFQLYDTSCMGTISMLKKFRDVYITEEIFNLKEWHSAYAFDYARITTNANGHSLTPGGHGNVWEQSPLIKYTDHLKGKRKNAVQAM